jgi:hypothetical protein
MYLLFLGIVTVVIIITAVAIAIILCVGVDGAVHGIVVVRLEIRHT